MSFRAVVPPPCLELPSGIATAREPVLVEALVSDRPVEAPHLRILDGLSRIDVAEIDPAILSPGRDREPPKAGRAKAMLERVRSPELRYGMSQT